MSVDQEVVQPTQGLSQEDSVERIIASSPPGVWGLLFSDCLTRRIDLRAPKAVLGRQQENSVEDGVQYIRLGGLKTSRRCLWLDVDVMYLIILILQVPSIAKSREDLPVRSSSLTDLQMVHG